jgi:hypothetical protein
VPGKLPDIKLKEHATSSKGSFGVSFSMLNGEKSPGYLAQKKFNKVELNQASIIKSFITSTAVNLMQSNQYSSGNETELIARGHEHVNDTSMMQHTLKKSKGAFSLTSRMWQPKTDETKAGWGAQGKKEEFESFDLAFANIYRRGLVGRTHIGK